MTNAEKLENFKIEICTGLNEQGFKRVGGERDFRPNDFPSMQSFMQALIMDAYVYAYLTEHKMIPFDFCPLCGQDLGNSHNHWKYFGRMYFMCDSCYLIINPATQNKREGCFIATVCYEDYNHKSVVELRNFRDKVLLKSLIGNFLVNFYYSTSPYLASHLAKSRVSSNVVRILILNPIVFLLKTLNHNVKNNGKR
jgi:hypothetical protein